ncbi:MULTISPECIES: DUF1496 domain-containing protein [Pseudoalteromonas]|uniref:DUF1496 domain-containing protein n=1 Tax=Pseudoalteromonas amylolytica TaxID=1859457 RepID=A0A1S1MW73_9GAMM|nr:MULTISPECIES: DUF1496 domain-containing protein [Pseudoalteromonas]MCF6434302.1 YnjH family protein [Pseudoalteromonas sp. MMG022]OHU85347.1 hypothetical protein BFC16_18500 [Pseudoalteromonas sp. JW3]OHU93032.1 hypothetical protein BET10_03215 [Pseudoalteromonas amylolytica]
MKSLIYIALFTLLLTTTQARAVDTNHKNVTLLEMPYNVCWYQGVQYSEGSLIKQLEHTFVCTHKYVNQPQSQLVWLKADKEGQPIRLDPVKTIRVK